MTPSVQDLGWLRSQVVGIDTLIDTPFGQRLLVYCDYTASGRCLLFIERYLLSLQRLYANTHTEDDITGRSMTQLLHDAENSIKRAVNAGPAGRVIACGTGATGAIHKLQEIVGVAIPPATRQLLRDAAIASLGREDAERLRAWQEKHAPVVFVGPYEHHSNEVSWRNGLATVVEVRLADDGGIDVGHLATLLKDPRYLGRLRIGSFSAASNVTGMKSPVATIARMLHAHDAFACFDYAASGPYVDIDMNPPPDVDGGDESLDAIFVSPHKFLGGPGSCGVLVFNERLYHRELPPSVCGGGTVDYVSESDQDFVADVETRERAGTPGVLQTLKAALAFELKRDLTVARIESCELRLLNRALARWRTDPRIEVLGNPDPERRIAIVSFNIRSGDGNYLHPKFVTALLNDLFGIQSRAGCSCAGPYGHRLLDIPPIVSEQYRQWVRKGYHGIKPGWCRVGFHFVMDDAEADYIIESVSFIAEHGAQFLPLYDFDERSGLWARHGFRESAQSFSLEAAVNAEPLKVTALAPEIRAVRYREYRAAALEAATALATQGGQSARTLENDFGKLRFFAT